MQTLTKAARRPVTILLVILVGVFTFLAVRSEINDRAIGVNSDRLENVIHEQCEAGQDYARGINTVLDTLIAATEANTLLTPTAKASRVVGYQKAMQKIPVCTEP